jgi:uncharacterized protein (UPF0332 family)
MDIQITSIKLKLSKAKELLGDANILFDNGGYNSVVSRLYYACYHATVALMLTKQLQSKTHKGLAVLLHKEFVSKGVFDPKHSAFFSRLMQERTLDDYGDFLIADKEDVVSFMQPSIEYINYIEKLIAALDEPK